MKISVVGYSGSGKTKLSLFLKNHFKLPILHLDKIRYKDNWEIQNKITAIKYLEEFINNNSSWIIDGNYASYSFVKRMDSSDVIIFLDFNRFYCYKNLIDRKKKFKNIVREDAPDNCVEKFDLEMKEWVLFKGRGIKAKAHYSWLVNHYKDKIIRIKNPSDLSNVPYLIEKILGNNHSE